jgi:uncharacterized coiled-coil protein SlyX
MYKNKPANTNSYVKNLENLVSYKNATIQTLNKTVDNKNKEINNLNRIIAIRDKEIQSLKDVINSNLNNTWKNNLQLISSSTIIDTSNTQKEETENIRKVEEEKIVIFI